VATGEAAATAVQAGGQAQDSATPGDSAQAGAVAEGSPGESA